MTEEFIVVVFIYSSIMNVAFFGVPLWKVLGKAGFNTWWTLMLFIPPFGVGSLLIVLFLAFRKWPNTELER